MEQSQKPVILTGKNLAEHTFYMKISQDIPSHINGKGNVVDEFKSEMTFETTTKKDVFNDNLANWATENIISWLIKTKINGKQGLKLSKDVNIEFSIDNKVVKDTMKFSLSESRLKVKTEKLAVLISLLFRKHTPIYSATTETTIRFVTETRRLLLVGKIDKPEVLKLEDKVPVEGVDFIEEKVGQ